MEVAPTSGVWLDWQASAGASPRPTADPRLFWAGTEALPLPENDCRYRIPPCPYPNMRTYGWTKWTDEHLAARAPEPIRTVGVYSHPTLLSTYR